jgi:hypothetical protein
MAATWINRTPSGFLFNMRAYGLLTGHHVDAARLPDALRTLVPAAYEARKPGAFAQTTHEVQGGHSRQCEPVLGPLRQGRQARLRAVSASAVGEIRDEALSYLAMIPRSLPNTVIAVKSATAHGSTHAPMRR